MWHGIAVSLVWVSRSNCVPSEFLLTNKLLGEQSMHMHCSTTAKTSVSHQHCFGHKPKNTTIWAAMRKRIPSNPSILTFCEQITIKACVWNQSRLHCTKIWRPVRSSCLQLNNLLGRTYMFTACNLRWRCPIMQRVATEIQTMKSEF